MKVTDTFLRVRIILVNMLAIPMTTQTANEVSLTFVRHVVLQYGIPNSFVTDQGSQFMGDIFKRL